MERLEQVANEMHYKFERLYFGGTIPNWIAQNCEKILDLQYNTATIGALPRQVDVCIRQWDINVVPWSGFRMIPAILIGPEGRLFQTLRTEQSSNASGAIRTQAMLRQDRSDVMPFTLTAWWWATSLRSL